MTIEDESEIIAWQQQAETFQIMLESALEYQSSLEEEIRNLACSLRFAKQQLHEAELYHQDTVFQRDQVIICQEKEIAHIKHILQIQQRLLQFKGQI